MREISLHLMDIVQNSIQAGAYNISIKIVENILENYLMLSVKDDGCGISEDMLSKVTDPFSTTRNSRKVGLGLSLFKAACERCDGELSVHSIRGKGTKVVAFLKYNHIDRAPIGSIEDTIISTLIVPGIDVDYFHKVDNKEFIFESKEVKKVVGSNLSEPEILKWIKEYIRENIDNICGGV